MIPYLVQGQGNTLMKEIKQKEVVKSDSKKESVVYASDIIKKLLKKVDKTAVTDASVLISGASGSGKELIAKRIHDKSYRKSRNFVVINCSILNEHTVESELFGHEKGAFTGADRQKTGLLEKAHGGTLVLDEVGDLSPQIQVKLLRFLQEQEIYRVGGNVPIQLDARVISCTNKKLAEQVTKGLFREDLYYRINTVTFVVPSLIDRKEDIPVLLKHFLGSNVQVEALAMSALMKYPWPGNIRELKNLCERLHILRDDNLITTAHLPKDFFVEQKPTSRLEYDPNLTLAELNKIYILDAMEHFQCKRTAARALGITVKTLYNRLHTYGVFDNYALHSPEPNEI